MPDQETIPPGGTPAQLEEKKLRGETRYRVLWGRIPDPGEAGDDQAAARPVYREILNPREPDGAYVATSAETARRRAFHDADTDQHPFIQKALKGHGLVLKHVAMTSWGDDAEDLGAPLKIQTREELTGKV